jgi:hypothetical protein
MSRDPSETSGDHRQGHAFVPEGPTILSESPMMDAWLAPGGGAVKLSALAMKMEARWLRRARPRPFGFAPGTAYPVPVRIRHTYGAGTLSSGVATMLGLRTAVRTMSICYGDRADPMASTAEIISGLHKDYQERDLEEEFRERLGDWAECAGQPAAPDAVAEDDQVGDSRPAVTSATIDVVVAGRRRPVSLFRLGEFSGFQLRDEGVLVTVLARHMGSQFPDIVRLTDLEPMLSAMEHPDTDVIAAALAEMRRQHIEQRRNQPRTAAEGD